MHISKQSGPHPTAKQPISNADFTPDDIGGAHRTSSDEESDILTFLCLEKSLGCVVVGDGLALPSGSKRRRNSSALCEMAKNGNSSSLRQRMDAVNVRRLANCTNSTGMPSAWGMCMCSDGICVQRPIAEEWEVLWEESGDGSVG